MLMLSNNGKVVSYLKQKSYAVGDVISLPEIYHDINSLMNSGKMHFSDSKSDVKKIICGALNSLSDNANRPGYIKSIGNKSYKVLVPSKDWVRL